MKKLLRLSWQQRHTVSKKTVWGRVIKIILLLSFLAGIFTANLMGREEVANAGILNDYFVEKFQYSQVKGDSLFFYIVEERLPMLLLMLLLMFTSLGILSGVLVLGWQGFSIGFMLSAGIAKYSVKGILLVLGGMFPQYLFYFPVYLLYCWIVLFLRQRLWGEERGTGTDRRLLYGAGVLSAAALFLVFTAGVFLESYLNPVILKNILNFL